MNQSRWGLVLETRHGAVGIMVTQSGSALQAVELAPGERSTGPAEPAPERARDESPWCLWLRAYARGESRPVVPEWLPTPASPFQARLRQEVLAIPFGETRGYGDLAAQLDSSPRAVGRALAANPVPLLVPCHRVVARAGPGGFQGSGTGEAVAIKAGLLAHEGYHGVG